MNKPIWIFLTVLIFYYSNIVPCHADKALEQSLSKGVSYGAAGKFDNARKELEKAVQVAVFAEPAKRALRLIEDMNKEKIRTDTLISFFKGAEHHLKEQMDDAIREYSNAIKSNPSYAVVYDNRGSLYLNKGEFNKAIADFSKAIELDPEFIDAYLNRGIVYAHGTGQYVRAVTDFNKAIELNPMDALAYTHRGYLFMVKMHDKDKACIDWKTACELGDCTYYNQAKKSGDCK